MMCEMFGKHTTNISPQRTIVITKKNEKRNKKKPKGKKKLCSTETKISFETYLITPACVIEKASRLVSDVAHKDVRKEQWKHRDGER